MADYIKIVEGEEPRAIAADVIEQSHEEFWHLQEAKIRWWWVDPDMVSSNRLKLATTTKVTGIWRCETGLDFVIKVSHAAWGKLTIDQRKALITHELRHCGVKHDKDGSPVTEDGVKIGLDDNDNPVTEGVRLAYECVPHDSELFVKDISEQNAMLPGLANVVKASNQLEFEFEKKKK